MAVLIPDAPGDCSYGERQVFERLERDLRDHPEWVVLHSLGLVRHERKLWGEIDFVLLTTKGIFVVEVKGGRVSCRSGRWWYGAPGQEPYEGANPWTQAKDGMFALRERVAKVNPGLARLLLGFGVIMPHETFKATGAEIEERVLLHKPDFGRNLGFFVGDLQRHWSQEYVKRHGSQPALPTAEEIREIRCILRPDIESSFSLGSWLNGLEAELVQLTNSQIKASRRMAANPRTIVRGRAGTGKTILAIDRARELARQGRSVLYLCFNQLLAKHVRANVGTEPGITVQHIHALYRKVIDEAGMGDQLEGNFSDAELFGRVFPETFIDAALRIGCPAFDVLVVDEAQDLLTKHNVDALDLLVSGGMRRGQWHLFLDPMQNIYGKLTETAEARIADVGVAYEDLHENCRNTRKVAVQTSIMSGIDMAMEGCPDGPDCDAVYYTSADNLVRKFDVRLQQLLDEDVPVSRLIVLSPAKLERSGLYGRTKYPLTDLRDEPGGESVAYCTMHAFKGLERDVCLVVDLDLLGNPAGTLLMYAGLSRARLLLVPFLPERARGAYERMAADFGQRLRRRLAT